MRAYHIRKGIVLSVWMHTKNYRETHPVLPGPPPPHTETSTLPSLPQRQNAQHIRARAVQEKRDLHGMAVRQQAAHFPP